MLIFHLCFVAFLTFDWAPGVQLSLVFQAHIYYIYLHHFGHRVFRSPACWLSWFILLLFLAFHIPRQLKKLLLYNVVLQVLASAFMVLDISLSRASYRESMLFDFHFLPLPVKRCAAELANNINIMCP